MRDFKEQLLFERDLFKRYKDEYLPLSFEAYGFEEPKFFDVTVKHQLIKINID